MDSSPLSIKEFRYFLGSRFFFIMALRMVAVAMVWHVSVLTKSTLAVGLLGLSEVLPAIGFALYAGHVVDISDRRKLLLNCILLYIICLGLLLTVTSNRVDTAIGIRAEQIGIYTCIFFTGIIRSFSGPAFNAILSQIVPRNILQKSITMSSASWQIASVIGPLLTGFLIAVLGVTPTLIIIMVFVITSAFMMKAVKPKPIMLLDSTKRTWESVKEGIKFVYNSKVILGASSLDMFAVFFGGATAMLPFYITDILKVGPIWFGWLNAAASLGTIMVLLFISVKPIIRHQGKVLLTCVAGFGLCIIVFGLSRNAWLSLGVLTLSGVFDGISVVIRSTILQLFVPDEMRGRVSSVNSMFINSSNELGQFESGVAANLLGVVPSVVFGGCVTLVVVITTLFKAPSLRDMEY